MSTARDLYGEMVSSRLRRSAQVYRTLADKLDGLAVEVGKIGTTGTPTASGLAHRAVHDVMWDSANASIDAVITAAADYDANIGL